MQLCTSVTHTRITSEPIFSHAYFTDDIMYHRVTIQHLILLSIFTLVYCVK